MNNTTSCDYFIGLVGCGPATCSYPVDSDANTNLTHSVGMWGLSSISDIFAICIKEQSTGNSEPAIEIYTCGGATATTPIYTCTVIDCNGNTLYVDWWWSGGDFYILLRV